MAKKTQTRKRRSVVSRKTSVTIADSPTKRGVNLLSGRYRIANIKTGRVFVGTLQSTQGLVGLGVVASFRFRVGKLQENVGRKVRRRERIGERTNRGRTRRPHER